jgi:hypothetical protein
MTAFTSRFTFMILAMLMPASDALADMTPEEFSYTYLEASIAATTIDLGASPHDIEGSGIGFALSLGFDPHLAFTLDVLSTTFDVFQEIPVETIKKSRIGITAHNKLELATDVIGNASLLKADISTFDGIIRDSDSDIGYEISFGIRHYLKKQIELEAGASHMYIFAHPAFNINAAIRVHTSRGLSFALSFVTGSNKEALTLTGRIQF